MCLLPAWVSCAKSCDSKPPRHRTCSSSAAALTLPHTPNSGLRQTRGHVTAQAFRSPGSCPPLPVMRVPLAGHLTSSLHCIPLPKAAQGPHVGGLLHLTGAAGSNNRSSFRAPKSAPPGFRGLKERAFKPTVPKRDPP